MQYQWESTDVHKIFDIPEAKGVVLFAGEESHAKIILNNSLKTIESQKSKGIDAIIVAIRAQNVLFRLTNFKQSFVEPRGIFTLKDYYDLHLKLASDLRSIIDNNLAQWKRA